MSKDVSGLSNTPGGVYLCSHSIIQLCSSLVFSIRSFVFSVRVTFLGTDKDGRPVIVFSACRLPPSYTINHQKLLE